MIKCPNSETKFLSMYIYILFILSDMHVINKVFVFQFIFKNKVKGQKILFQIINSKLNI